MEWEYNSVLFKDGIYSESDLTIMLDMLNEQGKKGWELVTNNATHISCSPSVFIFKRPKEGVTIKNYLIVQDAGIIG
jgi:hypothetical protein